MSDRLKEAVENFKKNEFVAKTVFLDYFTTPYGERFAILVTQGLWYRVRIFKEYEDIMIIDPMTKEQRGSAFRYTIPSDWAGNPDKYIKRGDVVCCKFAGILEHAGVYLGNGQVAHVSGHGDGKEASVARKGNLLGDFVDKNSDSITILYYALRVRSRDDIARAAEAYVGQYFRAGEYHLLHRNCLNFAALCAIGIE